MHIGFLTPEYVTPETPDGGLANYLKKTAEALAERGNNVTIFLISRSDATWYDGKVRIVEVAGRETPKESVRFSPVRIMAQFTDQVHNSKVLARRVLQYQKERPLDIVQASSIRSPGNALLHNHHFPLVCRASSYTPLWRRAYGRRLSPDDILIEWLEFRQMKESDASYSPSEFIAGIFTGKTKRPVPVIRTPPDLHPGRNLDETFYKQNLKDKKYVLFFGTMSRIKGADLFADIIPRVVKTRPDVYFVFIGRDDGLPGGQAIHDYLVSRAGDYREHIIYHPAMSKPALYSVILHAECVVLPSRVDNYPNACLEAQYFGIPVIGTLNSSLDEMIIDGKTGYLAKNGDPESIYQLVIRLLDQSPPEREEMKANIRHHFRSIVDQDHIGRLIDFYKQVSDEYLQGTR